MNTQAMPALAQALSGVLPQQAVRGLMQALGNCAQDVNQRAGVNMQPNYRLENGIANNYWNPSNYQFLFPYAGQTGQYVLPNIPGYTNGDWNSVFYGGNQFLFPTAQEFYDHSMFGGPNVYIGGNTYFDQVTVNRFTENYIGRDGGGGTGGGDTGGGGTGGGTIIQQFFPQPDIAPITLEPIQYVTDVEVVLTVPKIKVNLPKDGESFLTANSFDTVDVPTSFTLKGQASATVTVPQFNTETCANEDVEKSLAIDLSGITLESSATQSVLQAANPDNGSEDVEEVLLVTDVTETTIVSTKIALTTPFGGQ